MPAKKTTPTKKPAARTDDKVIARAVELRKQGLGLVAITRKLTDEGHKSATGKELRPQTVRQWLLRELKRREARQARLGALLHVSRKSTASSPRAPRNPSNHSQCAALVA
jgi:hypothetical protein